LAAAGVHHQTERERQVRVAREIANHLRTPVFGKQKIVLAEIANERAGFIADGRQDWRPFPT
jgi:hypothetical protein